MEEIMQTFQNSGAFSAKYKDYIIRENIAVIRDWSELTYRIKVILTKEVVCYVGEIETQKDYVEVKNKNLIGDGRILKFLEKRLGTQQQYVIPRFKGLPDFNSWAKVAHEVHV
jgi:hypothetical protein